MPYVKQTWANGSIGGTPLSAARLDYIEDGIEDAMAAAEAAAPLVSPALTGTPTVPTAAPGDNSTKAASTAYVDAAVAAGGGGGGGTAPTLRGSSQATSGSASYTIALPVGSAAGDTAVIVVGSGNNTLIPTGFAHLRSQDAVAGWGAGIFIKSALDAADIAAGTITINTLGGFSSEAVMVVYQGTITGVVYLDYQQAPAADVARYQNKDQAFAFQLTTAEDLLIFQTTRANTAMTSSIGALLENHQQANGSISVYRYPVAAAGMVIGSVNIPTAGFEIHLIRVAVRG